MKDWTIVKVLLLAAALMFLRFRLDLNAWQMGAATAGLFTALLFLTFIFDYWLPRRRRQRRQADRDTERD